MNSVADVLKAPFPWMGGKAKAADLAWSRLGNCDNFVEPFAGSLAVLLRRPADHFAGGYRVETVNDLNHYVVNVWRAIANAPEEVARWSDNPVTEADLHARHKWLVRSQEAAEWREKMRTDPHHFDAKVAGWWIWGACCWIGSGWCSENWTADGGDSTHKVKMPELTVARGATAPRGRPQLTDAFDIGRGVNGGGAMSAQVPLISGPGDGVYSVARLSEQLPKMSGWGWGDNAPSPTGCDSVAIPMLRSNGGTGHQLTRASVTTPGACDIRREWLTGWMRRLADRLRLVRTCYGHWARICDSDSTMTRLGLTGVFLDPPYPANRSDTGKKSRDANLYATDKGADLDGLRDEVLAWCRKWGQNKQVRVAVCGYEGDGYAALEGEGWAVESWEASGGYGNQNKSGKGKSENAKRERIWFSPHCLKAEAVPSLFDCLGEAA